MKVVALVPARRGSRRLPGKNMRVLAGSPLVEHALRCAERTPSVDEILVSTDDDDVADLARRMQARVLRRPPELTTDDATTWGVVRHALAEAVACDVLVLLQPTSPLRLPADVEAALAALERRPDVDGSVTVVAEAGGGHAGERDGLLDFERRGLRVTGGVYAWRSEFVAREDEQWERGRLVPVPTPTERAIDIDTEDDLRAAEERIATGVVALPWLSR